MGIDPADPGCFPSSYDASSDSVRFHRVQRDDLARAAFLDARLTAPLGELGPLPAGDLPEPAGAPPHFVLHTAFCCSTLLARCLDAPGINLSLREPGILMDLANALRTAPPEGQQRIRTTCRRVLGLLARPFADAESVLIKPTNAITSLYPLLPRLLPSSRFVLLHSGLRAFLVSVIKKGEQGRHFVRTLYNIFALDGTGLSRLPQRQAMTFTDLQVAALVWRHQIEALQGVLEDAAAPRSIVLDGDAFLADPLAHLRRVRDGLGLGIPDAELAAIASGPLFQRNAKFDDQAYDSGARDAEARDIEAVWGDTLDLICQWAGSLELDRAVAPVFSGAG